ncbi:MAG: CBS domain-containing protein [Desulfobacter sp.]|nr:MAG: CBS domain-containing protein [Desulfobacter sp.]
MYVQDVMDTKFRCLHPGQSIAQAVAEFRAAGEEMKKKIFGMMVIDDGDRLAGMVSMYDILLFIRPKHIRILGEMEDIDLDRIFDGINKRIQNIRVEDLMSTELTTVRPDTHLFMAMDIMVRKHLRRVPVVDGERVVGMLYRGDLFNRLMDRLILEWEV